MIILSGIYSITDNSNRQYIGSSCNIEKRWYKHLYQLRKRTHANRFLQRIYDKHGKNSLSFKIILICNKENLLFYEQKVLDEIEPVLNLSPIAGSPMSGRRHSKETLLKMSIARKGIKHNYPRTRKSHSRETRNKMRLARGRPVLCVELNLVFDFVFYAAEWCVKKGLTKSTNCTANINRAIRLKTPTVFDYHWESI